MCRRCIGILSVQEGRRVVSTSLKALFRQRRRGQSLDLLAKTILFLLIINS
ncbi:unnamed protein product [Spirodela intermedia]|uniref:Uncharacterized protein n=1 Tax=Spirodela intermedia TaxID=51605 RepID=A0A7I8KSU0_SPIIN|nr:unnamed protein product [Spirodela intermedia]